MQSGKRYLQTGGSGFKIDSSKVHDNNLLAEILHKGKVVTDKKNRIVCFILMLLQECHDSEGAKADGSYTVGIIQLIENGAFNDMREGFIEELQAKGYTEDKLTVDYKCAQGDATNLQTIAQSMADGDYDLVCTIATPATQAMVNLETDTPVVFIAVSAPVAAGVITDMNHPDKNATGTSNAILLCIIYKSCCTLYIFR